MIPVHDPGAADDLISGALAKMAMPQPEIAPEPCVTALTVTLGQGMAHAFRIAARTIDRLVAGPL